MLAADNNKVKDSYLLADDLEKSYPREEYSAFASMMAAKIAFKNNDLDKASAYLNWVLANASDESLLDVVKIRLADVYIDQKKFTEALALMMQKPLAEFQPLYYEKRGDLYLVRGDKLRARDAYKAALQSGSDNPDFSEQVQMKLDILGS